MKSRLVIEVLSDRLLSLVDADAPLERLLTGGQFTEGPIWNAHDQCLFFSDIPANERRRWSVDGGVEVIRSPSNKCNGMTYGADGNLYVCEHTTSSVVRERPDGTRETVASHWQGKELNSPNDVVVRADGSVYFTDPTYGRMPVVGEARPCELDFRGLYRVAPDGSLHLEDADFDQPNGLCFSPDETTLYANDTGRALIWRFSVAENGALHDRKLFASAIGDGSLAGGVVDGMKCDEAGNVWVTGPRGLWVFGSGGKQLGVVQIPEHVGNLAWGGPQWRDLFVCASSSVYRLATKVRGHRESYMQGWND